MRTRRIQRVRLLAHGEAQKDEAYSLSYLSKLNFPPQPLPHNKMSESYAAPIEYNTSTAVPDIFRVLSPEAMKSLEQHSDMMLPEVGRNNGESFVSCLPPERYNSLVYLFYHIMSVLTTPSR